MHKLMDGFKVLGAVIAVVSFAGAAARAENVTVSDSGEVASQAASARNWKVELNATMLGSYNENTFKSTLSETAGVSSDLGLDVAFRRRISGDLFTGLRISLLSRISETRQNSKFGEYPSTAFVMPGMWTLRYDKSEFLGQTLITPWVELEAGLTMISLYSNETYRSDTTTLLRPSARGSLGFDIHPWAGGRFFASLRASYLAVNEFSNTQLGVGSGLSF
jgi:hypothetical protein